jgi:hypothetical protein
MFRSLVVLGVALGAVVITTCGCGKKKENAWKLPVDAKQLPPSANVLEAEVIEGTKETDPRVSSAYTSAELGAEVCRESMVDPAHQLELMSILGPKAAKEFFKAANLELVQSMLECGGLLGSNLSAPFQTAIGFVDDSGQKAEVDILQLKLTEMPSKYGLTKRAFGGGVDGFCRTADPARPTVTVECTAASEAAIKQNSTWFLGKRGELDGIARTIASPKAELSTGVAALNDAANETEGLSSLRIEAQLTTSKPFLSAPCAWGAFQSAGSLTEFVRGCFPASDEKIIQEIDSKLRAAAFEIEPDVTKAGAVHGNVILVARDDDAAKTVEKDAGELAADWKAQLENNEAKLVKQAKTFPISLRQKSWAIIVDNFTRAIEKIKVTRSGRTIRMSFNEPILDEDRRDLQEARKDTQDRRTAVADLLEAIQSKKQIPQLSLTKLVGAPWATYLVALSTFNPKTLPPECSAPPPAPAKPAKGKKAAAAAPPAPNPKCVEPAEPPESAFGDKTATAAK